MMSTARDNLFMARLLSGAASVAVIRKIKLTINTNARAEATIKVVIIISLNVLF
jgi:hypothetical protein